MGLLSHEEYRKLLELLCSINPLRKESGRDQLLYNLPTSVKNNVYRSDSQQSDLSNIIDACNDWIQVPGTSEAHPVALLIDMACSLVRESYIEKQLQDLQATLSVRLGASPISRHNIPCPYPGMRPFRTVDKTFYGRTTEVDQIVQRLRKHHFLVIIGNSGSGKSSLVFAGVLPALTHSAHWPTGFWHLVTIRPGPQPRIALEEQLGSGEGSLTDKVSILLASQAPAQRLLLIVDQAEEIFTQANRDEQLHFVADLKALRSLENCAVLLTMRADFFGDLLESDLWPLSDRAQLGLAPLKREALRQAITAPANIVGVEVEAALVERLLNDAAEEPGYLPLLQETLVRLWDTKQTSSLTLHAYEQLGGEQGRGLEVALADHADRTLMDLNEQQEAIARRIFLRLVQFGEGRPDTRRQQLVANLQAENDDADLFKQTLEALVNNRLLTLSGEKVDPKKRVDLAHEALIRSWPTLHEWITEWRGAEKTRRRYEERATEWDYLGRRHRGLIPGDEILEVRQWLNMHSTTELRATSVLNEWVRASEQAIRSMQQMQELIQQAAGLERENKKLKEEMEEIRGKLNMLDRARDEAAWQHAHQPQGTPCPLCGLLLDQDAYARVRASYQEEGDTRKKRYLANKRQNEELQPEIRLLISQSEMLEPSMSLPPPEGAEF